MSEEQDDHRDAARGQQAARELELTDAAFDKIRAAALEAIVSSAAGQAELREKLYRVAQMTDSVRALLHEMVAAGDMANARIELATLDLLRP